MMSTRERYERPAALQALEGIGLVVGLTAGVLVGSAIIAFFVSWAF